MILYDTKGMDHSAIDSAAVDPQGRFSFKPNTFPIGFYQLATGDDDRADIILDPGEKAVNVRIAGSPIQEHLTVVASRENQAMWAYKRVSRQVQSELTGLRSMREGANPQDRMALLRLDSMEASVEARRKELLDEILKDIPDSYFAYVVNADRRLMAAIPAGSSAISEAFGWADGRLLRSSIYPKALMAYLQSIPFDAEGGLHGGVDSLMYWARPDTACWRYTRLLLLRAFDQFGAEDLAQFLVDEYVMGPNAMLPPDTELLTMVVERMRVAVGAQAPEILLPDPRSGDTTALSTIYSVHRFTVLLFYSSNCDHCHAQMPGLRTIRSDLGERGVAVVGVALDADLQEFVDGLEQHNIDWPSYSELIGWGSPAAKVFGVKATPAFIVLDATGTIVARPIDLGSLRAVLLRVLP